jgi:tricorn protease
MRLPLLLLWASSALAETHYLIHRPALSATTIVFSYAGDLWSVPRAGGDARRLTSSPGVETDPQFSPDGSQIAFTGEYDGNTDVFVIPAAGGVPKRLTWHPAYDGLEGWTPDGKRVLFCSQRDMPNDGARMFTVDAKGGWPDAVPLPIGCEGSYSPDGSHLAYVPLFQWEPGWKRYRGGQTKKIWIADLADSSVTAIPRENSNDFNPMWVGGRIYFLSDRNGPVTLFSYDVKSRKVKQLIENRGFDFKSASAGPGAIVYEQFGALGIYDLAAGKAHNVEVRLAGDFPEVRPHFVNVSGRLRHPDISPNGARAVFEARGEIITIPAEKGDARNLTSTPAANEREPVWAPNVEKIAYFSDESGEYQLHLRAQDGMGETVKIPLGDKPGFYMAPQWSPDSSKIAYLDSHSNIWYIDTKEKKPVLVATDYDPNFRELEPAWSPDSKWLAYARLLPNHLTAVFVYSLAEAKSRQVTDGLSDARSPAFDRSGKYLYFTASTDSGPALEVDLQSLARRPTRSIYLTVLSKDEPSPLAPESDDEKVKKDEPKKAEARTEEPKRDEPKKDEPKKEEAKKEEPKKDDKAVRIDFDNIGQRILALPMPARRYEGLGTGKDGLVYAFENTAAPQADARYAVHRYELGKRKADVAIDNIKNFALAASGEKMLYQYSDGAWYIANATGDRQDKKLKTDDIQVRVDPPAEWRQMYHEAWRVERDFFYDPNFHGLDLKATEERYAPYLESLASRRDLNYILEEALGELTVGHLWARGGDNPDVNHVETGLLGADYKQENGRYRFARVYNGENWNPDLRAPLTQPGVNVAAGDYLLAVNGQEVRDTNNLFSFFEGTAGKSVLLKVGSDPSGDKARDVTVIPVSDEKSLRHLAWIEDNRRKVDELTKGRVAYIYMPDTSLPGYTSFTRYFFAQVGKEAAIVDERFNHGGHFATDIIEYLQRKEQSVLTPRDGADFVNPAGIYGPKVMITNEFSASGGDAMPWYFRRAGVGKLVGKRTWGGLVGLSDSPDLMDGGAVSAPCVGIWNTNGKYDVENQGVAPDYDVELDPKAFRQGHDTQLEKAVEVVMQELEKHPPLQLKRPPYPNYHPKQ